MLDWRWNVLGTVRTGVDNADRARGIGVALDSIMSLSMSLSMSTCVMLTEGLTFLVFLLDDVPM
jgi:hypothetical protein